MRARQFRRRSAGLVVIVAVGATAGCGGAAPEVADAPPPARPSATATVSAADEEAAREAALAAYAGYLDATRAASRESDPRHPELTRYLGDPLLTRVRVTIRQAKENGAMRTGKLVSDPTVTSVSLETDPATVEIQDCLDTTGYRLVYTHNKKVVPGSRGSRHLATATATRYPDGKWRINAGAAHQDQPC
ncbi:hypothetical protein AWW66_06090 [Micromonospora rosaria]|uniref:Secreted protein/lipoprotein n=1 Tax=Micromonospora rosaria TaxID=47874 RepID=A0A136PWW9_9ACTN|nr:hypothetical protein [Micromonospora rosaria]KXK62895.1 hypothetical protein AWW66_06090 [Micromonospora rosaria]